MKREEFEELIWLRIDGSLPAADLRRLERHLEEHPEAHDEERTITELFELLERVDEVDPPPSAVRAIEEALAAVPPYGAETRPAEPRTGIFALLGSFAAGLELPRNVYGAVAAAAALVLVMVVGIARLSTEAPIDEDRVTGAITLGRDATGSEVLRLELDGMDGTLSLSRRDARLFLDLEIGTGDDGGEVTVEVVAPGLGEVADEQSWLLVEREAGGVRATAASAGIHSLSVELGADASLAIRVHSREVTLLDRTLDLRDVPEIERGSRTRRNDSGQ